MTTADPAANNIVIPQTTDAADWRGWRPDDRATVVFVRRPGELLLIRKLRGLGAGKINGPGGKLEPGESALACAIREVEEELGVTPLGLSERGRLRFQFRDGYALDVSVFMGDGCRGQVRATDEAIPLWTPLDQIPYDEMWADDRIWLPLMLAGQRFSGRFLYDGDRMCAHALDILAAVE